MAPRRTRTVALLAAAAAAGCGAGAETENGSVAARPLPAALVAEAGFIDVPPDGPMTFAARMFYAFFPADRGADHAPLVVLFNGGPGGATSGGLLPGGTGPFAVVSGDRQTSIPFRNPASWTSFANLLYVDERTTGFSYEKGSTSCGPDSGDASLYVSDAGDFVRVILDVLDAHPSLARSEVVLAGESFGATRATLVAYLVQHYASPPTLVPPGSLPWLEARVQRHVDRVHPELAGRSASADEMAAQFGRVVLLEGSLGGKVQVDFQRPFLEADPIFAHYLAHADRDASDVRRTREDGAAIDVLIHAAMRDPSAFTALVGVEPADVMGLPASQRGDAVRSFATSAESAGDAAAGESSMRAALGELAPDDAYFLGFAPPCRSFLGDASTIAMMLDLLPRTTFFVTRARYDALVYGDAFPGLLQQAGADVAVLEESPRGAARPGVLEVAVPAGTAMIRFPKYESGHRVAQTAGSELHDDVRDWLAGPQGQ